MDSDIKRLSRRYPQLLLPIQTGARQTEKYKDAVLGGQIPDTAPDFACPKDIALSSYDTPAGRAEILYLGDRGDFVHAYRALGYRCEPAEIPDSVGAAAIRGLINWEKIHNHRDAYLAAGGEDWSGEFNRFTSDKKNYLDSLILLSALTIRKYHELTHFVCRGLCPDDIDALRDEVIADAIGLVAAFGRYDTKLARRFLGTEGGVFHAGGRLSHYVKEDELDAAVTRVNAMIDETAAKIEKALPESGGDLFARAS